MHHRFRDPKEHEANAHTGGEQHGKPGDEAISRLRVIGPELDITMTRKSKNKDNDKQRGYEQDIEPAGIPHNAFLKLLQQHVGGVGEKSHHEHAQQ